MGRGTVKGMRRHLLGLVVALGACGDNSLTPDGAPPPPPPDAGSPDATPPDIRELLQAIPGLTIPIWFVPNVTTAEMRRRTGNPEFQYEIACAQLCGLGHARMRGFVTVQTPEEFDKWLASKVAEASEPDPFR